jgi:hypothetical protein
VNETRVEEQLIGDLQRSSFSQYVESIFNYNSTAVEPAVITGSMQIPILRI